MCVGDAASLVDPFSGEGIGNGLVSAKMTSRHFDKDEHSEGFPEENAIEYMEDFGAPWQGADELPQITEGCQVEEVDELVRWKGL